ncbi:MAG: glycosyltransferase [Candidatus Woesearchaeota archaeon]
MRKRILMIAACPFPGNRGTPSRILKMSESLSKRGYIVDVLTYYNKDFDYEGNLINIHRIRKIPFYNDNSPGPKIMKPLADILLYFKGKQLLKKNKYDLIHAHHIEGGYIGLKIKGKTKTPLVYDSHIILEEEIAFYKKFNFTFLKFVLMKIEGFCYSKSSGIVYVAQEAKDYIFSKRRIDKPQLVLPTGTNVDEILQMVKTLKNPYSPSKIIRIVYTGSIAKYQNIEDIIEVAKLCSKDNFKFYIVTGASEEDGKYLQESITNHKLSNVHLVYNASFKEQMTYAAYAHILLSPRHFLGGIPQKITNYAALKKKIVASSGSVKILDEKSSYLYNGGNIKEFYKQLKLAISEKSMVRENNAFKIVKKYDWDYLVQKLDKFYGELR